MLPATDILPVRDFIKSLKDIRIDYIQINHILKNFKKL